MNKNIVTLFVENNEGKLLLQKRSYEKGGTYGFISGHAEKEESDNKAMIREVKEEMGMDIKENDITKFYETQENQNNFNFYYMKRNINIDNLVLQKEEVESVKWCTLEEINGMIKEAKLYKNHVDAFDIVTKYLEK